MTSPFADAVEASVSRVLQKGEAEDPDKVLTQVELELKDVSRESVKSALISLVNQGVLELTWEGQLRRSK